MSAHGASQRRPRSGSGERSRAHRRSAAGSGTAADGALPEGRRPAISRAASVAVAAAGAAPDGRWARSGLTAEGPGALAAMYGGPHEASV